MRHSIAWYNIASHFLSWCDFGVDFAINIHMSRVDVDSHCYFETHAKTS